VIYILTAESFLSLDQLRQNIAAAMPESDSSLKFSWPNLELTGVQLTQVFSVIPSCVTWLKLNGSHLYRLADDELVQLFSAIPPSVSTLDLSDNYLESKTGLVLKRAFASLHEGMRVLILKGNILGSKPRAELIEAFGGIPSTVISLNLKWNHLYHQTDIQLAQVFDALHKDLVELNLNGNSLNEKTGVKLGQAFAALPKTLNTLKLCNNNLDDFSLDALRQLKHVLPQVQTLYLSYFEVFRMTSEQRIALWAIFPGVKNPFFMINRENITQDMNPLAQANKRRELGFPSSVPSLLSLCGFFSKQIAVEAGIAVQDLPIVDTLKPFVQGF